MAFLKNKRIPQAITLGVTILMCVFVVPVFASGSDMSIATVATTITKSFKSLARLFTAGAYIAGIGFALSAIFKFKQHKDNPQQTQIGTPIALLFISAALLFLPNVLTIAGQTVFGSEKQSGGPSGIVPKWTSGSGSK